MKQRKVIYISGASIAALALSFAQARADDQSKPEAGQHASASTSADAGTSSQTRDLSSPQNTSPGSSTGSAALNNPSYSQTAASETSMSSIQGASAQGLRVASDEEAKQTTDKLAGQKLRGQDGKAVGTIKDFLVDSRSGQIRYAVVSSGGFFGLGERLRLVPYELLQAQANGEGFTAAVTKQQLDSAPTVDNKELDSARVTLDAQQQQQTQQALSSSGGAEASSSSSAGTAVASSDTQSQGNEFVRASKMKDSEVQANGSKIGSIENIVIEQGGGEAMALVTPEGNIGSDDQKFLVPLSQIQLGNSEKQVTTTLTQNDFQAAAQASAGTSQSSSSGMAANTTDTTTANTADTSTATATASDTSTVASTDTTAGSSTSDQRSETGMAPQGGTTASGTVATSDTATGTVTSPSPTGSESGFASGDSATQSSATQSSATQEQRSSSVAANTGSSSADSSRSVWSDDKSNQSVASTEQSQDTGTATTRQGSEPAIAGVYGDMNSVHDDENDPAEKTAATTRPTESTQSGESVNGADQSSTPAGYASTGEVASPPEGRVNNDDSNLTPTGATSADQSPNAKPELISAAQQIRQALDQNEALSGQNVQVKPEGEKIVLRGTVTSDDLKEEVENLAKGSGNNVEIDNQIEVKQR